MKRVLVVEDEASIREMVALNLKMAGCDTENQKASEEEEAVNDHMIDLAADVLVAILMEERAS